MTNEQYQQLKEVIQKANPEIMELKFGCKVERRSGKISAVFESQGEYKYGIVVGAQWPEIFRGDLYSKEQLGKILGRPIRLADVLVALNKAKAGAAIQDYGCWMLYQDDGNICDWCEKRHNSMNWNLLDDNLDNQSDECKQFLYDLLVK